MDCRRWTQRSVLRIRLRTSSICEFSYGFLRHVVTTITFFIIGLVELRHNYHVRQNSGRILKQRKNWLIFLLLLTDTYILHAYYHDMQQYN
jgi:hypothetical protein